MYQQTQQAGPLQCLVCPPLPTQAAGWGEVGEGGSHVSKAREVKRRVEDRDRAQNAPEGDDRQTYRQDASII